MACKLQVAGLFSGKGSLIHFPTSKSKRYIFREKAFVVTFNNVKVTASSSQKHLGILLDQQPTLINMSKVKRLDPPSQDAF